MWSTLTTSNFYHDRQPGAVYNNSFYITDSINAEVYDPSTRIWSNWPASPLAGSMACALIWKDTLNLFGGEPDLTEGEHTEKILEILVKQRRRMQKKKNVKKTLNSNIPH